MAGSISYSEPGLQSRTVYVYAYSVTGDYTSTSTSWFVVDDKINLQLLGLGI